MRSCPKKLIVPSPGVAGHRRHGGIRDQDGLGVEQPVDAPGAGLLDEGEGPRALEQPGLSLAPRVQRSLDRGEDVLHAHAAQPGGVLGRVVGRVEEAVVDGVGLAVPPAGDGVAGLREVERLPVAAQRHHVEAVVRVVQVSGGVERGGEVRARGLRALDGVEEVTGDGAELQEGEEHDGDDRELAVAERPAQPGVAQQQEERQPEDHEEAAAVVADRAAGGDERPDAEARVHEEEHDEGPARMDGVHAGQRHADEGEAEEDHELRRLVEVRARLREAEADGEAHDDGRGEGGGEHQRSAAAPPAGR